MRDAVRTKLVWLHLIGNLHHTCSPDIPPQIDSAGDLSYEELRVLVVNAVCSYRNSVVKEGPAKYKLSQRVRLDVVPDGSVGIKYIPHVLNETLVLTPGGRYLLVMLSAMDDTGNHAKALHVYDIFRDGFCVWRFTAEIALLAFDFEITKSGTLLVAIVERKREIQLSDIEG